MGEKKELSGEAASRAYIELPEGQQEALEKLAAAGKPVVAVMFSGRPLAIPYLVEHVPAILAAWHPGVEAGNAIADILFGTVNPSAKLTATFPGASGQCPMYYAHINTGRPGGKSKFTSKYLDAPVEPLYPLGYGLSYTTYEYSGLKVEQGEDSVTAAVIIKRIAGNRRIAVNTDNFTLRAHKIAVKVSSFAPKKAREIAIIPLRIAYHICIYT